MDEEIHIPERARVLVLAVAKDQHCEIESLQEASVHSFSPGDGRHCKLKGEEQVRRNVSAEYLSPLLMILVEECSVQIVD